MLYDSVFNNALDDFYRSAAFVSAIILSFLFLASPAQANYIYDHNTGSWKPTSRTVLAPPGSSSPFNYIRRESPPSVSSTGAFQNKTGGAFGSPPLNGTSRTVPVTITGNVPNSAVKASLLSRLAKGGLAGIALGEGVELLLNSLNGVIGPSGQVVRLEEESVSGSAIFTERFATENLHCVPAPDALSFSPITLQSCLDDAMMTMMLTSIINFPNGDILSEPSCGYGTSVRGSDTSYNFTCVGQYTLDKTDPRGIRNAAYNPIVTVRDALPVSAYMPIPEPEIADAVNSDYEPKPSDYPFLSSEPSMMPQTTDVEPIPRLTLPPTTTTTIDLDTGKTTTVETNIWHDFNIKDNATSQPKIDIDTTTKTDTYVDGEQTSSTTITNNTGLANPEGAYDSDGNRLDIPPPIDCDLFPTACAWMEWTQEEPEEPDDDLSELLQEVPIFSETFTITGGAAACPAPLVLNLSQFGSRTVSYQPLCDLASTMKFLYLALMSFAAAVLLHRSISRV